jgi:outer membrane receptor protein involved in Fe transport
MQRPRFSRLISLAFCALLLTTAAVRAQVTTATLYGIVTDPSGATVPGAAVTITNEQTNAAQNTATNQEGEFTFNFLPVGRYTLLISAGGFKEQTQQGVELSAGQRVRLNYTLEVGAVSDKVTVTAESPLINAVNSEQLIAHTQVEAREMPLARRDWTNLLNVGTGLDVRTAGTGTGVAINGLPPAGLSLTVDGTQASGSSEGTSLTAFGGFNLIKVVSLEAISEVNVSKGILSAEHANTLSGNVNVVTKSGTNEYHGSLFENYNGAVLNARNQFLATKPNEVFNQFGGSIGGPIVKNKLFFFGVYEGYRLRRFSVLNAQVPTPELKAAAIAAVPAYKPYFDLYPNPTQPYAAGASTGTFIGTAPFTGDDNHVVLRGDYNINDLNRLNVRYTRGRPSQSQFADPVTPFTFSDTSDTVTANYTRASSAYSSETRFGFGRTDVPRLIGISFLDGNIPAIGGLNFAGAGGEILESKGHNWSVEEVLAFNRGRHSIKVGGLYQTQRQTRQNFESPIVSYANTAALLANTPNTIQVGFGVNPYVITDWTGGLFVQDDFKLRPNVVISAGLRYDYFSVPSERDNRLFNRNGPNGLGSLRTAGQAIYNPDKNNFAPRLSVAWTVGDDGRTVVRGGFGMFYTRAPLINIIDTIRNSETIPFRYTFSPAEITALGLRYPVTRESVQAAIPVLPWSGTSINPDFPTPYSMQWLVGVQRQLTRTIAVDSSYVGTRGVHLLYNRMINTVNRVTGLRPYAGFGQFRYFDTSESTTYHAWQTSLEKRYTAGLLFNAHYTWSRSMSYGNADLSSLGAPQDPNNLAPEYGPSPYDVPHRFTADYLYELPFAKWWGSQGLGKRLLLAGWQTTGIFRAESGAPISANNFFINPGSIPFQRIDYLGGDPYLENGVQYLNPAAFARVPVGAVSGGAVRPGTLGRNALRLPGYWNFDAGLAKNFNFTESVRAQLRADFINAFNHTSFDTVQTGITNATFGRFTRTRGARQVQLNFRLTF